MQQIQEQSFLDGYAVGELTGRLKYEAPLQVRHAVPLVRLKDCKGVFQKYNYTITGVHAHPSDSEQVLIVADKTAEGIDPTIVLAFAKDDLFMSGWGVGRLAGQLRYAQPDQVEEWVQVERLNLIQQILDDCGYTLTSLRIHPEKPQWASLIATRG